MPSNLSTTGYLAVMSIATISAFQLLKKISGNLLLCGLFDCCLTSFHHIFHGLVQGDSSAVESRQPGHQHPVTANRQGHRHPAAAAAASISLHDAVAVDRFTRLNDSIRRSEPYSPVSSHHSVSPGWFSPAHLAFRLYSPPCTCRLFQTGVPLTTLESQFSVRACCDTDRR